MQCNDTVSHRPYYQRLYHLDVSKIKYEDWVQTSILSSKELSKIKKCFFIWMRCAIRRLWRPKDLPFTLSSLSLMHARTRTHARMNTYTHAHTHEHTHAHTHTYMHTHIHKSEPRLVMSHVELFTQYRSICSHYWVWHFSQKILHPRHPPNRETLIPRYLVAQIQMDIWFNLNLYWDIWVSGLSGFRGCKYFQLNLS